MPNHFWVLRPIPAALYTHRNAYYKILYFSVLVAGDINLKLNILGNVLSCFHSDIYKEKHYCHVCALCELLISETSYLRFIYHFSLKEISSLSCFKNSQCCISSGYCLGNIIAFSTSVQINKTFYRIKGRVNCCFYTGCILVNGFGNERAMIKVQKPKN